MLYVDVRAINGTLKQSITGAMVPSTVSRMVKQAGADTTLQNAVRDGAEWAWVPVSDTCAFCITLASRGWQHASKKVRKGLHANHIHANCDCTFAVRHDGKSSIEGYDPDKYLDMYYGAEGSTPEERIKSMRRINYAEHKDKINAQKRNAYRKTVESEKRLTQSENENIIKSSNKRATLNLDDIRVGKSLGAVRKSYDILDLKTGERFDLVDGTWIEKIVVFAGKGVDAPYRKAWKYVKRHPETKEEDWQHVKGIGTVDYYGEERRAELHWSQCEKVGIDDMFIKEWLD